MEQQEIIAAIEERVRRLRIARPNLSIGEVCRRAKVHPTTFSRWKRTERNPTPIGLTMKSLSKIEAVIAEEEQAVSAEENRARPTAQPEGAVA